MINRRQPLDRALTWTVFAGALALIYGEALWAHMRLATDPAILNDDARQQIYPFFRYADPALFPHDYIGDYYLACLPWGYRAIYTVAGYFDVAAELSKVVPYVGLLITVAGIAASAYAIGGRVGAWVAAALCLGSSLYLGRMTGGLPRAFAFPLLATAAAALSLGRIRVLAALVPIGAAFYPAAAVPIGIALALTLLVLPERSRAQAQGWSLKRRFGFVAATGMVAVLVLLPAALSSREFGSVIRPSDVAQFPEAGPRGRYGAGDRAPFAGFFEEAWPLVAAAVTGDGTPWFESTRSWVSLDGRTTTMLVAAALFTLGGWLLLAWKQPESQRFLTLGAAAIIGHTIAIPIAPLFYLPQRYVAYPVPILATIMIATSTVGYVKALASVERAQRLLPFAIALVALPWLVMFGGRGTEHRGLTVDLRKTQAQYAELARLPKDALIAAWPRGMIDNVPYASRRQVLITFETHQAFHVDYALEMRRRMEALTTAYFSKSPQHLIALHRKFGVTHLLVERDHFTGRSPRYFHPFHNTISRMTRYSDGRPYEIMKLLDAAKMGARKHIFLIELPSMKARALD